MTEEYGHISDAFDKAYNLPEEELLMTDQQPITPPPEIVHEWIDEAPPQTYYCIAEQAAQWGADQELKACCEELKSLPSPLGIPFGEMASNALRAARRPNPPSLKEQALKAAHIEVNPEGKYGSLIIRALELLPDE
jgi:hypothetical protein